MKHKILFLLTLAIVATVSLQAQLNVGSTAPADASAILQATSTTKGFLPPVMTTTQRNAIVTPAPGLLIFNSTTNQQEVNSGTTTTPVWGANTAATFYNADGTLATNRVVALNGKQLNFSGTQGILTLDSTGKNLTSNANGLAFSSTGGGYPIAMQLAVAPGINGLIVSTNNLTTGVNTANSLVDIALQIQSVGTGATKTKQYQLRAEGRTAQMLGHSNYSVDTTEFQLGKITNPSFVLGDKYALARFNLGIGTGTDSIRSPLSITNNATGAKITLFDGAGVSGYSDTAHYGFGISNGRLNYDVPWGAMHMFNSSGKNGSGTNEMWINNAGVTIPRRLNMNNGNNIFIGSQSGLVTANGGNTFLGIQTGMVNTSGNYNGFTGYQSGIANTTGNYNTFSGALSGITNTTGYENTFIGAQSGNLNTTGIDNTFLGLNSGYNNTTASKNVFVGWHNGNSTTTGGANAFLGADAGASNTTGYYNVFTGMQSGFLNTTGYQNTFTGLNSGYNNTTGINNTGIGNSSGPATSALTNTTSIGANTQATVSNTLILGTNVNVGIGTTTPNTLLSITPNDGGNAKITLFDGGSTTNHYGFGITGGNLNYDSEGNHSFYNQGKNGTGTIIMRLSNGSSQFWGNVLYTGSLSQNSDRRLKRNIVGLNSALGQIMQLIPYSYDKKNTIASTDYNIKEIGFIAQDVRKILPQLVFEGKDSAKTLSVNYIGIIPLLTKAIQEQQAQNDAQVAITKTQATEIASLKKENISIAAQLADMKDLKIAMAAMQTELNKIAVTTKVAASNIASK